MPDNEVQKATAYPVSLESSLQAASAHESGRSGRQGSLKAGLQQYSNDAIELHERPGSLPLAKDD